MRVRSYLALAGTALVLAACSAPLQPVTWTAAQKATIESVIGLVSSAEITNDLTQMNIVRHVTVSTPAEMASVESAIVGLFASYGLTMDTPSVTISRIQTWDPVAEENVWVTGTYTMDNIVATRPGADPGLPPVVLCAHWDSMPQTVGMDDNASGCAGVLEIARVLQGLSLKRTIVFVLFAFEEVGLQGSVAYTQGLDTVPHAVIDLEMIGFTSAVQNALPLTDVLLEFPSVGDFIGVVAYDTSKSLGLSFCTTAAEFVPDLPTYSIGADANLQNNPLLTDFLRSDHTPFWAMGAPAIMVTDTSFLREGTAYHTAGDTIGTLDLPFMVNVIRAGAALACLEAELD